MSNWRSRLVAVVLYFLMLTGFSQSGDFYVSQHVPKDLDLDNINFDILTDHNGLLVIANRSGILQYDGSYWEFFPTPSASLSLAVDEENTIYVGCVGQFGKLDFSENTFRYVQLFEVDSARELFVQTLYNQNRVYFFGGENIHVFNTEDESLKTYKGDFVNLYKLGDHVFVNGLDTTFLFEGENLVHQGNEPDFAYTFTGENETFSSDLEGLLYKKKNEGWEPLPHNAMLAEMDINVSGAVAINDTLIACSTLTGGCLFLNVKDTSYLKTIDYHSGLPDNEIFAIHADDEDGVWVAHEFGLTRIAPLFPAHSYSHYPGLEGSLFSASWVDGTLWVSSSLGVYYFDRDTTFTEKVYYVTENASPDTQRKNGNKIPGANVIKVLKEEIQKVKGDGNKNKEEDVQERKGFLKSLFKKKKKALQDKSEQDAPSKMTAQTNDLSVEKPVAKPRDKTQKKKKNIGVIDKIKKAFETKPKYIRKTSKVPTAISYRFTKVENASGKFKELVKYQDKLLGASTSGVFEIAKGSSQLVIPEPVRTIRYLEKTDQLLVNTYNRVLKLYTLEDHIWVELDAMVLDDVILNTYEDTHGGLWLVGTSTVFQASLTGQGIQLVAAFEVANKIFDVMNVISRQDTLTFINYEGYFYLDKEKGKVIKNEELMNKLGPPQHHFQDQQGNVWVFNGKIWYRFTEDGAITSYDYLSLFKDLRFVSFDEQSGRYWLITKGNELLNYDVHNDAEIGEAYEMFLRSVTTQTRAVDHKELFTLDYDETNLSFELSRPEYAGFLNLEYQYRLEGLQPKWSTWSTNNVIDFSFLPPGSYKLHVRTRDSFGRLDEEEVISFKVNPPYWQQPWFYSLQFLFFGGLMVVSFRLNQSNRTNQLLSEGLTVLTIVLFIEFLQSVIGSSFAVKSSPIVDFAIDAFVALLIFPLERFLRIYLTGGRISIKNRKVIKKQVIQKELKD